MMFRTERMNVSHADEILRWSYEPPYDMYNQTVDYDSKMELLNGSYTPVLTEHNTLFGYYCTGNSAKVPTESEDMLYPNGFIDKGLGMNPLYTGRGHGVEFCAFILSEIKKVEQDLPLRLTVATFNTRAIRVYEKLGFRRGDLFKKGKVEFMTMYEHKTSGRGGESV
ncbi:GNAT family N-acetyltransferase [Halobacillus fulvus]|nr:GNAT family N-acetyltransferase [Halobacillus fulvus]